MPDGIAVCIHDFGVVHYAGHAIGVRNIFGGVKVVHRAVQRGIAVSLPAGKGCAVGGAAAHIPHGIKVNLGDADFAQGAVIFHNAVCGRDCVAVLIGRFAAVVGVISTAGILGSVVDGNGGFYACTGDKFGAAFVGSGNVGIIVSVVQPDYRIVAVLGDFDIVTALAQRSVGHAGMIDVCPIAKIACGRFAFHDDKLARITLGVVKGMPHGIRGRIGCTVDDRISAIALALHTVSVVATCGLVFARYSIPLENLILGIGSNLVAGFAVGFPDVDLQRPFIVFHLISIVGIGRYRNGLFAAIAAPIHFKTVRNTHFLIAEFDVRQFCLCRCNRIVHHALGLALQLGNRSIAGAVGGCIGFVLRGVGAYSPAAAVGGFAYGVVQRPTCRCSTSFVLKIVIVGMASSGDGLFICGRNIPCAAVNSTAFGDGFNLDGRAVHLFIGFKLHLVGDDAVVKIKAAACGLRRGFPVGVNFLHDGFGVRFVIGDFGANHSHSLPARAARLINIGIVAAGGCVGVCALKQRLRGPHKNFGGGAVGVILDNLHLRICIDRAAEIQQTRRFCGERNRRELLHTERKLGQTAPNSELVAIVVAGYILVCANHRSIHVSVQRTVLGLAICARGAAVGGFAVEPDQPSAVDFGDLGDLATCHRRGGALGKGGNFTVREGILGSRIAVDGHLQGFGQGAAVRRSVNQLCGKIRIRLYIYTQHRSRGFAVFVVQQTFGILGGLAVVVQQGHTVRQN